MSEKPSYVYVIAIDDLGLSKIGISDNPGYRLKQLATGSPFKMRLEHAFATPRRELAEVIERECHKAFSDKRKSGEWFELTPRMAVLYIGLRIVETIRNVFLSCPRDAFSRCVKDIGFPPWMGIDDTIFDDDYAMEALEGATAH